MSRPQHYLIGYTSWVIAYQHWRLLCRRKAKTPELLWARVVLKQHIAKGAINTKCFSLFCHPCQFSLLNASGPLHLTTTKVTQLAKSAHFESILRSNLFISLSSPASWSNKGWGRCGWKHTDLYSSVSQYNATTSKESYLNPSGNLTSPIYSFTWKFVTFKKTDFRFHCDF